MTARFLQLAELRHAHRRRHRLAEVTGVRTLDAMHLSAAQRVGGPAVTFVTLDARQAQAARTLGFTVVGA